MPPERLTASLGRYIPQPGRMIPMGRRGTSRASKHVAEAEVMQGSEKLPSDDRGVSQAPSLTQWIVWLGIEGGAPPLEAPLRDTGNNVSITSPARLPMDSKRATNSNIQRRRCTCRSCRGHLGSFFTSMPALYAHSHKGRILSRLGDEGGLPVGCDPSDEL